MTFWRMVIAAVVILTIGGGAMAYAERRRAIERESEYLQREMRYVMMEYQTAARSGQPIPLRTSRAKGDAGVLGATIYATAHQIASRGQTYKKLVDEVCIPALQPRALGRPGGLAAAHKAVEQCRTTARGYRAFVTSALNGLPGKVEGLNIDPGLRTGVIQGMKSSMGLVHGEMGGMFDTELVIYDRFDALIDWLAARRGRWQARGDMILFNSDADVAEYNRRIAEIQQLNRSITDTQARQQVRLQAPW